MSGRSGPWITASGVAPDPWARPGWRDVRQGWEKAVARPPRGAACCTAAAGFSQRQAALAPTPARWTAPTFPAVLDCNGPIGGWPRHPDRLPRRLIRRQHAAPWPKLSRTLSNAAKGVTTLPLQHRATGMARVRSQPPRHCSKRVASDLSVRIDPARHQALVAKALVRHGTTLDPRQPFGKGDLF
jgi:hypothetical protein